jgi:hypothetical protein
MKSLADYLHSYMVDKTEALKTMLPATNPGLLEPALFAVRCGTTTPRSLFLFLEGTSDSSVIIGQPGELRSLEAIEEDWGFLLRKIDEHKVEYDIVDAHFRLNNKKLVRNTLKRFLLKRESLAFLATTSGIVPLISAIVTGAYTYTSFVSPIAGSFLWMGITYYSFKKKGDYDVEP